MKSEEGAKGESEEGKGGADDEDGADGEDGENGVENEKGVKAETGHTAEKQQKKGTRRRSRIRWISPWCRPVEMVDFKAVAKRWACPGGRPMGAGGGWDRRRSRGERAGCRRG